MSIAQGAQVAGKDLDGMAVRGFVLLTADIPLDGGQQQAAGSVNILLCGNVERGANTRDAPGFAGEIAIDGAAVGAGDSSVSDNQIVQACLRKQKKGTAVPVF